MDDELQNYFEAVVEVAKEAGERVKTDFYKSKDYDCKANHADVVTETDKAVEELIMSRLAVKYPSHKFIGEETVSAGHKCELTDDPTWIIDPIDGTMNFVHGIPHTCISIGLAINKQVVVGIIHCPILGEMYTAVIGQGSFCNGTKLSVSKTTELTKSVVVTGVGFSRDLNKVQDKINNLKAVIENCHGVRMYGSAAINMCMVARGSHDAYFTYGIHCWDIAAGALIVREAGGIVIEPTGEPLDLMNRQVLAACNTSIANQLSKNLTHVHYERD